MGEFVAPSTETAVTFGAEIPRPLKNESEVGDVVAASQLDDPDALARRRSRLRETRRPSPLEAASTKAPLPAWESLFLAQPKMRFRLRTIVEPENTFHNAIQIGGNRQAARPAAVRARRVLVTPQVRAKGFVECLHGPAELHVPARAILTHNL